MANVTVTYDRRPGLERFIRSLPSVLTGAVADPYGVASGFVARIGWRWASLVIVAFDTKSKGGTDDSGDSWPPNSPEYLAYCKGPKSSRTGGGKSPGGKDGMLSDEMLAIWWKLYAKNLAWLVTKHPPKQAKGIAAGIAWKAVKELGAKTLLEQFGNREDTILVDEGTLRRSILPGDIVASVGIGATYRPRDSLTLVEAPTGYLVIGTRVPYASAHHYGRGVPERTLWPKKLPDSWIRKMLETAMRGLQRIEELIKQRAI